MMKRQIRQMPKRHRDITKSLFRTLGITPTVPLSGISKLTIDMYEDKYLGCVSGFNG